MRKLLVVFPVLVVLAVGCGDTRRDWTVCDHTYQCNGGLTCDYATGLCVKADTSVSDTPIPPEDVRPSDTGAVDGVIADAKDAPAGFDGRDNDASHPGLDGGAVDSQPVDGAGDARLDAPGSCGSSADCIGVPGRPICSGGKCVACSSSSQCDNDAGTPFCTAENTCASCSAVDGGACSGSTPVCSASGRCVECTEDTTCGTKNPSKGFCYQNSCAACYAIPQTSEPADGGAPDGGAAGWPCTAAKPKCVAADSPNTALVGKCVECESSADCKNAAAPICDSASNTCVACTTDKQCADKGDGPGICMFHQDGRCASESETIYAKNSPGCSGGTGTSASPYCRIQDAISAVTTTKRVIVATGGTAFGAWSASTTTQQISVIGRQDPMISVGAGDPGIHVVSGNLYVRGFRLQGSSPGTPPSQPGIIVDSGATLGLDRCNVIGFAGGLLVTPGASFDIANSVFAANASGQYGTDKFFGGVYLGGSAPSSGPARFWFNTVVYNGYKGVVCADSAQALTGVLANGNTSGDYVSCRMDVTSVWGSGVTAKDGTASYTGDLTLDSNTYRLTTTNFCRDHLSATTPHPFDDIDGQSRPKGAKLDCGADEYYP